MTKMPAAADLLIELIRCKSVTPIDDGAIDILIDRLKPLGFDCHDMTFDEKDFPTRNLFARIGTEVPHFCFAGHTDVVPADDADWDYPPFEGRLVDDKIYGRGTIDMKGGIACFIAAVEKFLSTVGQDGFPGSISFLITGDEEGPSFNGTPKVLKWMEENGHIPDVCLVGEPTGREYIGDLIKIGRRGSLNVAMTIHGEATHVGWPELGDNPITTAARIVTELSEKPLDDGTEHFNPSTLSFTTIDVANPAENVVPAHLTAHFNARFADCWTSETLQAEIERRVEVVAPDKNIELKFSVSGESFMLEPGELTDVISEAIYVVTGKKPGYCTAGGISDARYIKNYCPVMELGLRNRLLHKRNEHTSLDDLDNLTKLYKQILTGYFTLHEGEAA